MQFEYSEPQTDLERALGGYFSINLFGKIIEGDDIKFRQFLERSAPPPRISVYLNSSGGDVEAAMGIGRLIRDASFSTSVGTYTLDHQEVGEYLIPRKFTPGKCLSAATLIFLGGRLRYFDPESEFGVHQFSFKNPSPHNLEKSQRLSAAIARYIEDMDIPAAFLELSAMASGHDLQLVTGDQLRALKVVTDGETPAAWGVEVHQDAMWVRGQRDSLFGHGKVMVIYAKSDGFSFAALVEAMGHERELMTFGLVEIIANGEDVRIDVTDRCLRSPTGIYIMFMIKLSDEEAKVLTDATSIGIRVRASEDAEIFLGIAAMSTEGGGSMLKGLYHIGSK
ncbi:hypothetical protein [Rhizobium mayense]|uniref:Uncharacterized protein n=1 Tax=Rhizobium mayense TaxID=1312184 RepID=A0ABT7JW31_9HYPH|nr:hypothetical protein [Rhizobium mayense]MDL2400112.1 hypothetical protein [Rhizobium mayense]